MFSQKCASTLRPTDSRNSKIQSFQNLGAKRVISQSTQFCPPSHQSWWSGGLCCSHTIILHLCLRSGQISTRPCNGPHKRKRQTSPRIKGRHLKASCCSLGWRSIIFAVYTLIQNWNERVTSEDTVYVLGDAFWKNEENSIQVMQQLNGHKHLIQGNHDRVKGKLRPYWESIEQYAEVNDENRLVILSHYPILFYKNQHYGAVMLYGHVHNTREWKLVEKWKKEQWAMGIPSRLINVGCMMDYMRYTPRTLTELLDANPMPEIFRVRKDGSAVEVSK